MTASASTSTPTPTTHAAVLLAVDSIVKSPTNPRKHFNEDALKDLATSIAQHGVLQPILVRKWDVGMANPSNQPIVDMMGKYEIVCGERRWRASQIAQQETILAIVRELTDLQVLEIQVVENLQREDVHPLEEAEGYERLMKFHGYTADTLGEKVGKSRAYIYARLKLLAMAPAARELFFDGKLTASTALLIARIPGAALQVKAATEITKPNYQGDVPSYRAAAEIIQNSYTLSLAEASFGPSDAKLVPEAGSCTDCPKRSGNDRVLFADIENADVCTDPKCFNNKREVNYLRLREIAEKSGKEVITGKSAQDLLVSGNYSLRQHKLENLDARCQDDPERRTYREILGKGAVVTTLVEDPRNKTFIEAIDTHILANAMKKAGIKPATIAGNNPQQRDWQAEKLEREAKAKIENIWRAKLFQAVRVKLGERFAESKVLAPEELTLLAVNLFQKNANSDYNDAEAIMALWGHPLAEGKEEDAADAYEAQIAAFSSFLVTLSAAELCLFLIDISLIDEAEAEAYAIADGNQPLRLLAQAKRLGIDPDALRDPPAETSKVQPKTAKAKTAAPKKTASTPIPAAQAQKVIAEVAAPVPSKKATAVADKKAAGAQQPKKVKPKANSALASPAKEPATPVLKPASTWPFPVTPAA